MSSLEDTSERIQAPVWTKKLPGLGRDLNAIKQPPLRHNAINGLAIILLWGACFGILALGSVLPALLQD